jgi:NADPH2:quinone reductase
VLAWTIPELGEPKDVLLLGDVPEPSMRPGQVVIQVEAAALNFPDVLLARGHYQHQPRLPFVAGGEVAGRIVAAAENSPFSVGEPVMALTAGGGFAERAAAWEGTVFPLGPVAWDWAEAAAFPASFQTAYAALHLRGALREGETVLIHAGAGGVGSAAIQLAVAAGARVIATARGPEKTQVCLGLGADMAFDLRAVDLREAVRAATDGAGVDVVVDPVGGSVAEASLRCLAFGGRLVLVGFASGPVPVLAANHVLVKNVSVVGLHWGLYAREQPGVVREVHQRLADLVTLGRVRPVVSGDFEWARLPALLQDLADGRTWGKVVVRPSGCRP